MFVLLDDYISIYTSQSAPLLEQSEAAISLVTAFTNCGPMKNVFLRHCLIRSLCLQVTSSAVAEAAPLGFPNN